MSLSSSIPGVLDAFGGAYGAGGGGGGYSSATSSSGPVGYTPTFGGFGGIQTGGTQGVDVTTLAIIAAAVVLAILLLRR